jgi:predicted nicotinamide N-methyase
MTLIDEDLTAAEVRLNRRLRVAGIVAILAAAVGSVSAAATDHAPVTDHECSMDVAANTGFTSGCRVEPDATSAR